MDLYQKAYRDNNREKIAKQKSKYYQDHKEEISDYNADYWKNNKEKITKRRHELIVEREQAIEKERQRKNKQIEVKTLPVSKRLIKLHKGQ